MNHTCKWRNRILKKYRFLDTGTYSTRPFNNLCYVDVIVTSYSSTTVLRHTEHKKHVALLSREAPDYIPLWLWPPNSPDLNPVDYHVWSVLEQREYHRRIRDISRLKTRLVEEWQKFDQKIIDWAINLTSGVYVWGHAFNKKGDTLSIGCETLDKTVNWPLITCNVNFKFSAMHFQMLIKWMLSRVFLN